MANEAKQKIIDLLTDLYKTNGYVTEDEVFELSERENLSVFDINYITEYLLSHGVIISEEKEKIITMGTNRNLSRRKRNTAKWQINGSRN